MPNYTFTQDDRKRGGKAGGKAKSRSSRAARAAVAKRWETPTATLLSNGQLALILPKPWMSRLGLDTPETMTISLEALLEHSQPSP